MQIKTTPRFQPNPNGSQNANEHQEAQARAMAGMPTSAVLWRAVWRMQRSLARIFHMTRSSTRAREECQAHISLGTLALQG